MLRVKEPIKKLVILMIVMVGCQKNTKPIDKDPVQDDLETEGGLQLAPEEPLRVLVDPNEVIGKVHSSHLGFSQEWWRGPLEHKDLISMFKRFKSYDTGPLVLRIGGSTADQMKYVPGEEVWAQFSRLHRELGFNFILNLNLGTATKSLTKMQKDAAMESMPEGSILQFEIGNEPNYFSSQGYKSNGYLNSYPSEFNAYASHIGCGEKTMCAGPAWGHIYQTPSNLEWFVKSNRMHLDLVTTHFYKANNETYNDPVTLLDESSMQKAMQSLKAQVKVASDYELPLRVDESNPISGGGLDGVSNVFAAALWIVDTAFETASQGAVGLDLHQGSWRYAFYLEEKTANQEEAFVITPQPAYYGILFFLEAVVDSGTLPTHLIKTNSVKSSLPGLKYWAIRQGTQIRVAILNKNPDTAANVALELPGSLYSDGRLLELVAPSLFHRKEITLAGQNYDNPGGFPVGQKTLKATPKKNVSGNSHYQVIVPKASAVLLSLDLL